MIVPFKRTIHRGLKGNDVLATKRALARAGLRKWGYGFTERAGDRWVRDIKRFQKTHGLKVDGVYGPVTHKALLHYFDERAAYLYNHYHLPGISLREKVVSNGIFGYNHRDLIHYTQGSERMYGVRNHIHPPSIPRWEDCSSFVTWCYYVAGAPDPNHLGYNGYGFTGTLASHGVRVSSPKPGDLGFYGWFPYHHVVMYVGSGRSVSNGNEYGPELLSASVIPGFSHWRSYL